MRAFILGTLLGVAALFGLHCIEDMTPAGLAEIAEDERQKAIEELNCRKPVLETTAPDGTELWSFRENCYHPKVYFSRGGAQYSETIRHGKQTETIQHQVPNEVKP